MFDHYEVIESAVGQKSMDGGDRECVITRTRNYTDEVLELTESLDRCYTVRAVFAPYDDTPDDLKQQVRLRLTVTNDVSGWNSEKIPVYLKDSCGARHLWEVSRSELDDAGESSEHLFDLGAAMEE